jgi:predicted unusual protein kinase regulating ubiquinone biosynthesis (AarF/ABC1/UbiB family)
MADDDKRRLDDLARGFRQRTLVTAKLAAKLGVKAAGRMAFGAKKDTARAAAATSASVSTAEDLVKEMGALKGLVMKVGQIASYMPGAMPPEAQRVLAKLQSESTSLAFPKIDEVIRRELGGSAEERFTSFEQTPFAAASIGQVHRAKHGDRDVAVKVQYPGIEELLTSDLRTAGMLLRLSTFGTALDGGEVADEVKARLLEECDYVREAESQRLFTKLFDKYPDAHVPAVVADRSSRRVLTSELVRAKSFHAFADAAPQAAKDRAGAILFRTCFETVFGRCIYNADPHPGNYLFHDDGKVTFLDFGCVRRYDPKMIAAWKRVALSVLDDDRNRFGASFGALGMVPDPKRFDWDHQWTVMRYLYRPFMSSKASPFTYSHEYVEESYGVLLFDNPNQRRMAMPAEWVFLNRLQWGLNSILASLNASGGWGEIFRAAVEAPEDPA